MATQIFSCGTPNKKLGSLTVKKSKASPQRTQRLRPREKRMMWGFILRSGHLCTLRLQNCRCCLVFRVVELAIAFIKSELISAMATPDISGTPIKKLELTNNMRKLKRSTQRTRGCAHWEKWKRLGILQWSLWSSFLFCTLRANCAAVSVQVSTLLDRAFIRSDLIGQWQSWMFLLFLFYL